MLCQFILSMKVIFISSDFVRLAVEIMVLTSRSATREEPMASPSFKSSFITGVSPSLSSTYLCPGSPPMWEAAM